MATQADLATMDRGGLNSLAREYRVSAAGKTDAELKKLIGEAMGKKAPAPTAPPVRVAPAAAPQVRAATPAPAARPAVAAVPARPAAPAAPVAAKPAPAAVPAKAPAAAPQKAAPVAAAAPPAKVSPTAAIPTFGAKEAEALFEKLISPIRETLKSVTANATATDKALAALSSEVKALAAKKTAPAAAPPPAPAPEEAAGEEVDVTPEWIAKATLQQVASVCEVWGIEKPANVKVGREALLAYLAQNDASQAGGSDILPFDQIDRAAVSALFGTEDLLEPYQDGEVEDGIPVWLCAPPDPVSATGDGTQQPFAARVVQKNAEPGGLCLVEIYEGPDNISEVDVPPYYLYAREEDGIYSSNTQPPAAE